MNRRQFLASTATIAASSSEIAAPHAEPPIEVAAYYFPQYHPDPRNDGWHGKGWTEWDLVTAATPRYPGHRQPKRPAWGTFDESNPNWAAKEVDIAADHGITTFLYDWYWYEDGPFLQHGLERGFLKASNNTRIKFALMWANHDWNNIHPATFVNRPETLASGRVTAAAFERLTAHVIKNYFSRPNYLRINGAPFFSIYELGTFIAGLGSPGAARKAIDRFRENARSAGAPDVHINAITWGVMNPPADLKLGDPASIVTELGLSSVGSYAWVHHYDPGTQSFPKGSYAEAAKRNAAAWEELAAKFPVPYHPNVSMGWDPSPRTIQSDRYESRGYPWTAVLEGNTPEAFEASLRDARRFVEKPGRQRIVTINAWNEWTEGSYLLPDKERGSDYLKAVKAVFPSTGRA